MPERSSSLHLKLLLMSLSVVIVPMLLAMVFSFLSQKEQIDRSLDRELNASMGACRLYYEKLQERLAMMTLAVGNDNTCKTTIRLGVLPQLQKQVTQLAAKYALDFLAVTDIKGQVIALSPSLDEKNVDLSNHPFVIKALQGEATTAAHRDNHSIFSSPASSEETKNHSTALFIESAMPIKIRETTVGSILSGIRLSGNIALMMDMQKAADADRTILLMEREIAASSFKPDVKTADPLFDLFHMEVSDSKDNGIPAVIACADDGIRLAVKWYPINGIDGQPVAILATMLEYERAAALINTAVLRILGVFIIGMLLASIISFFVSRSIAAPVKSLSAAMQKLQEGEIGHNISDGRSDEIGILVRGFKSMASKLHAQFSELQKEIEERKLAELHLSEEKERLGVTLRSIGDGVITTDTDGKILMINKIAEKLTGWSNEDACGKQSQEVFNIINEKTGLKCASPVARVLKIGRIIGLANHTSLIAKDGTMRSIADSGAPIRDRTSKIIGVVIVFRDITHEKRMEEELIKIRKLESVGVLAGGIAHDFNNILSAIMGNIELAAYHVDKDPRAVSLLSDAKKATRRAAKLTQQLLTFSRGGDPVKEATSLPKLITESADFILHGSSVSCTYTFQDDLWLVDIDSGQIGQVIQNIVLNAKHAMPEGGRIHINCSNVDDAAPESLLSMDDGNYVRITIRDTGVGIPREILDRVFDPYFSTKQEGSGLGLAICHSIINKHDGHITVQSTAGKGTVFTIYLPAEPAAGIDFVKQHHTKAAIKAATIMIMDDEEMIRNVAREQLAILGHETILVKDGEQAINRYQELQDSGTPVDLVIMDLTIPGGMGGQEASQRLLKINPDAKIIVASGYSNDPVVSRYREYGFCAAVAKPFDLKDLQKGIEEALS